MKRSRILFVSIFILSLSLRFILCLLNREANDNHAEVVEWIINKHELPGKADCWECFQPKAYYLLNAGVVKVLQVKGHYDIILTMQLINFIFSFFTLFYLWKFINRQPFTESIKIIAFALFAFNPCLIGINAQATNDTLEILAGVLTIYFADRFFGEKKLSLALQLCSVVIIASLVKGSGLVLFASLCIVFCLKIGGAYAEERRLFIKAFAFMIVGYLAIIPVGAGYIYNYQHYKNPFVLVFEKDPPPAFFQRSYVQRPGITSVADGYFTFRYFDMIRQPYITSTIDNYPLHRTSLWSQLYGRTMFMHFDQHPNSWISTDDEIILVGHFLIILGIIPLLFLLAGILKSIKKFFKEKQLDNNDWIHLVFVAGFLLFMIKYSYSYRDYSIMKSIFIFPALPSFIWLFMDGLKMIKSRIILNVSTIAILIIVFLSIYDIYFLIDQLSF